MAQLFSIVSVIFGGLFTVGVSFALGSLLIRRLRLAFYRLETSLFAFVIGAACLSLLTFVLCLLHQARWQVFLIGGIAALIWALLEARKETSRSPLPAGPRAWNLLFGLVFTAFFVCYLFNAIAPEISPDGSSYHLGNVARLWRHQGFAWDYHSIYSSLSQGMEMLFLMAFSFGRHPAAALVHFAFQAALPLLMLCYGRRFGCPRVGAFAGLIIYACPVVGITGTSAYNDLAVATLSFAGFYLIQVVHKENTSKLLFIVGILSGFSYAIKYTAGLAFPLALGLTKGRRLFPLTLGAAVMAGPWLLRNWLWLGNPTAPFLNSWFPNPYWTAVSEHQYLAGLSQYPSFKSYCDFILQLTVLGGLVPGMIGPAFLLLPVSLLALRNPHGRQLLLAGAVYAIPACLNTEVRFLIPALPFFALALGLAMAESWGALPTVVLLQVLLCWPAVMTIYCDRNAWRVRGFEVRAALRLEPEAEYISSHVGDYSLKPAIEREVPEQGRIFSFSGRAAAYLDRDIVVGYESTQGLLLQETLQNAAGSHSGQRAATQKVKALGVGYLLVNSTDAVANDMNNNFNEWGLTKLSEANGTTLYRID